MLNLADTKARYESKGTPYSELIPWMMLARSDMALNKDGGLLVCYRFDGVDIENLQRIDSDRYAMIVEHAMRVFDERITVWWTVDRRRTHEYPEGTFPDDISAGIDAERRTEFMSGRQFANKHYLSILFSQNSGSDGFMDKIGYFSTIVGHGFLRSVWEALKATYLRRSAFALDAARIDSEARRFDEMLAAFDETVKDINLKRMHEGDLMSFLHDRCNPASNGQPVNMPQIPVYVDGWIPDNTMYVGHDLLLFESNDPVYVAGASVKDWPELTEPGLLDELLRVPGEITISQCFRYTAQEKSRKFIDGIRKHNLNTQKSLMTYLKEAITNTESDRKDEGKVAAAADASAALASLTTQNRVFGYYNLTVLSYGSTAAESEDTMKYVSQVLRQSGFLVVREKLHLLSAWAGTLPGQWGELVRWFFVHTGNLADISPFRTLATGETSNKYLTEQTGRNCPALTALSTTYSTPFYFNFHNGDLAHAIVVGPSRSGKSVFDNFLISQFRKYYPCRIYIFDKDYSCKIPTLLQDGQHIDMTGEGGLVRLNPLLLLEDKEAWPWIAQWLELILSSRGYQFTAEDDAKVWRALENTAALPKERWQLRTLSPFLSKELGEQLAQWIGDGSLSRYFDNVEDDFSLGDFTAIEMGGLFMNPRLASAFLEYAFYRIKRELDGTPTLIYIEEAWFMLSDERFTARINDWLRTLAKKNTFLVMATQSLDELASSDIFATIIDNIPNKIFLANNNANAHYEMYTRKFGLNSEQVEQIRMAIPKTNYYIVTPTLARMAIARFSPNVLACLRSDSRAQKIFTKHYENRLEEDNWKLKYIEEVANG